MVAWLLILETFQIYANFLGYLTDKWNIMQLAEIGLIFSIFVIDINGASEQHRQNLPIFASSVTFIMCLQMYYWSRINFEVSKYEYIIMNSIQGTRYFMMLCLITILAYGLSTMVLDVTQLNLESDEQDYEQFIGEKTVSRATDAVFTQYLLMLGEFEILGNEALTGYERRSQNWIWLLFFAATLITNVVFFNQLVSVIGSEYNKLWEKKERWGFV
jgi:hypothetical protein